VVNPTAEDVKGRKNEDFFSNLKAQSWWALRTRFQRTYRAVTEGVVAAHDDLISIPSGLKLRAKLCIELTQPTYTLNNAGKIVIEKAPDGARSPNLADSVMIWSSPRVRAPMVISDEVIRNIRQSGRIRQFGGRRR